MAELMIGVEASREVWAMDVARFGEFAAADWGVVKSTENYEGGELRLSFRNTAGLPVKVEKLSATIGRTTEAASDLVPVFAWQNGDYVTAADLGPGKWMILLEAFAADGTRFHQRLDLFVAG